MKKKKYEVVWERREVYREVVEVWATSKAVAEELSQEVIDEHDWSTNVQVYADESIVQTRQAENNV